MASVPFQELIRPLAFDIADPIWNRGGIPLVVTVQVMGLLGFFVIALCLGAAILPMRLSGKDKEEAYISPYASYNKIIFSAIYFGGVYSLRQNRFDLRSIHFHRAVDLYLFQFKSMRKAHALWVIAFIGFFSFYFINAESRSPDLQLFMNFLHLNLYMLLTVELVMLVLAKCIEGEKNVRL